MALNAADQLTQLAAQRIARRPSEGGGKTMAEEARFAAAIEAAEAEGTAMECGEEEEPVEDEEVEVEEPGQAEDVEADVQEEAPGQYAQEEEEASAGEGQAEEAVEDDLEEATDEVQREEAPTEQAEEVEAVDQKTELEKSDVKGVEEGDAKDEDAEGEAKDAEGDPKDAEVEKADEEAIAEDFQEQLSCPIPSQSQAELEPSPDDTLAIMQELSESTGFFEKSDRLQDPPVVAHATEGSTAAEDAPEPGKDKRGSLGRVSLIANAGALVSSLLGPFTRASEAAASSGSSQKRAGRPQAEELEARPPQENAPKRQKLSQPDDPRPAPSEVPVSEPSIALEKSSAGKSASAASLASGSAPPVPPPTASTAKELAGQSEAEDKDEDPGLSLFGEVTARLLELLYEAVKLPSKVDKVPALMRKYRSAEVNLLEAALGKFVAGAPEYGGTGRKLPRSQQITLLKELMQGLGKQFPGSGRWGMPEPAPEKCSKCGAALWPDEFFCRKCGTKRANADPCATFLDELYQNVSRLRLVRIEEKDRRQASLPRAKQQRIGSPKRGGEAPLNVSISAPLNLSMSIDLAQETEALARGSPPAKSPKRPKSPRMPKASDLPPLPPPLEPPPELDLHKLQLPVKLQQLPVQDWLELRRAWAVKFKKLWMLPPSASPPSKPPRSSAGQDVWTRLARFE